jgi:hypothetical protein
MLLLRNTGCFALFFAVHVCIISGFEPKVNRFFSLFWAIFVVFLQQKKVVLSTTLKIAYFLSNLA